jgi:parvulin-like peptidyl-prolyl isomerase
MFLKRVSPFFLLIVFVVTGCSQDEANLDPPHPDAVASFSGGVITKAQIKAKYESLMPCCKDRYQGKDGRRNLIKEMVLPEVIANEIKRRKIDIRKNIRKELGNLKDKLNMSFLHIKFHEQILNSNEKYAELKSNYEFQKRRLEGFPLSERFDRLVGLHNQIHPAIEAEVEQMSRDHLAKLRRDASITKNFDILKVAVTEEELKDFYHQHGQGLHGDEYRIPEKIRIQQIVSKSDTAKEDCPTCPREAVARAREKANNALLELKSGADFKTVAQLYGDSNFSVEDPRWLARGTEPDEFEEIIFNLEDGEISPVLEEENNFYIVKALGKQPGRLKSFEEIRNALTREYRWQKGEEYLKLNRDRILFSIDSKPYSIGDFLAEYNRANPSHQCHHMQAADLKAQKVEEMEPCDFSHNSFEDQKKFVNGMIDRELIIENTYSQMLHVEHGKEIEFVTMANLYPLFHSEEMDNLIHISDEMVAAYYRENEKDYMYPAKVKLNMIVIKGGENEESKKKAFKKAEKAYAELKPALLSFKKASDFADVALKYSEDEVTASKGGRLEVDVYECRNSIEYMLFHGFHQEVFALKPGDISDIFEFENNYYIVQIREMDSRRQLTLEEVREKVKEDLHAREHQKVMVNWEDNLLQTAGFKIYDRILAEMLAELEDSPKDSES